jgi:hypothetical protein
MYSYHIVAELRQFRGVSTAAAHRVHRLVVWQTSHVGTVQSPAAWHPMDRFFLAMMVSAVLLLIGVTGLLVNGHIIQEPAASAVAARQALGPRVR